MAAKTYETDELSIQWNSELCIHAGACVAGSPAVFDPKRRPWVIAENGTTSEIVSAIEQCPTGALQYHRRDGTEEDPGAETIVVPIENGPLVVRGPLEVRNATGGEPIRSPRLTFCRCGSSGNQPFCDNSHRKNSFESSPPGPSAARDSPEEICPPQDQALR